MVKKSQKIVSRRGLRFPRSTIPWMLAIAGVTLPQSFAVEKKKLRLLGGGRERPRQGSGMRARARLGSGTCEARNSNSARPLVCQKGKKRLNSPTQIDAGPSDEQKREGTGYPIEAREKNIRTIALRVDRRQDESIFSEEATCGEWEKTFHGRG